MTKLADGESLDFSWRVSYTKDAGYVIKLLAVAELVPGEAGIALVADAARAIRATVQAIEKPRPVLPHFSELAARAVGDVVTLAQGGTVPPAKVAFAMELVGERWSMLIIRELMLGGRRFSDLRASLPGISAKVLTERLAGLDLHHVPAAGSLAIGGDEVYIYVLLEHKSAPDPEIGVQLLGYLAEIWRRLDRQRLERAAPVVGQPVEALVEQRRALGLPAINIGWCGWQQLGFARTPGGAASRCKHWRSMSSSRRRCVCCTPPSSPRPIWSWSSRRVCPRSPPIGSAIKRGCVAVGDREYEATTFSVRST